MNFCSALLKRLFGKSPDTVEEEAILGRRLADAARPRGTRRWSHRNAGKGWTIEIEGMTYPVRDWSEQGFLATGYTADHEPGDTLRIAFTIPLAHEGFVSKRAAVVVRVDRERHTIAGKFIPAEPS